MSISNYDVSNAKFFFKKKWIKSKLENIITSIFYS
ncbi:hypothetical protein LCGC14_0976930 [marine sediment metagenome]|uniref:Uncharacterized protein n=1 Tax=marine sediment metagenome TaxID=412755 RepID=A0A0F9NW80_9ZZZZ